QGRGELRDQPLPPRGRPSTEPPSSSAPAPLTRRAAGQLVAEAGGDPVLRVVDVAVERPVVPDRDTESGALVVLSAGSRTAEQLADLAEACADGGHEVVGVVVARPVRTRTTRSAGRSAQNGTAAVAVGAGTTGGTA
ncbi:polysaccharide biosynthesis protein, partial [Streptomyces olivaceus]